MKNNLIRENIITNFLNPCYKNTVFTSKEYIINHIKKNSWFPIQYFNETDTLIFHLDDELDAVIKVIWEESKLNSNNWVIKEFK